MSQQNRKTIQFRITASFGIVLAILCWAAGMAAWDLTQVLTMAKQAETERFFKERQVEHLLWVKSLAGDLLGGSEFRGELDPAQCALGRWLSEQGSSSASVGASAETRHSALGMEESHRELHSSATKVLAAKHAGRGADAAAIYQTLTIPALERTGRALEEVATRHRTATAESSAALVELIEDSRGEQGIFALLGIAVALVVGFVLTRFIRHGPLAVAVNALSEGAGQVTDTASQVAAASQTLARGASDQAAALEQTSASNEEINSMAARNSENAGRVSEVVTETREQFARARVALEEMVSAMAEIDSHSGKISKINKTIDEIAFQTNILALNAAVEAARAGEAGMGFSVVAEEVRSLAQRCSQAAKDTAELIQESITKSSEGKAKVSQVATMIGEISEENSRMSQLVEEVRSGSAEQARGIQQVGKAISQMEQVTQMTAASSEQGAAAAEELHAQAESFRRVVHDLRTLVG